MSVIFQLFTPARYLLIKSESHEKAIVDFGLPVFFAGGATVLWAFGGGLFAMTGGAGVVAGVSSLIQVLVGFYVATLAAIATFPTSSLDEFTLGLTLHKEPIKRRRFLAYLFGYLALLSLLLFIAVLFQSTVEGLVGRLALNVQPWLRAACVFIYQLVFWQMVFVTLLGLFYLTDRIHRSNAD